MSFRLTRKHLDECRKDKRSSLFCATVGDDKKFYKIVASKEKIFFWQIFCKTNCETESEWDIPSFYFCLKIAMALY